MIVHLAETALIQLAFIISFEGKKLDDWSIWHFYTNFKTSFKSMTLLKAIAVYLFPETHNKQLRRERSQQLRLVEFQFPSTQTHTQRNVQFFLFSCIPMELIFNDKPLATAHEYKWQELIHMTNESHWICEAYIVSNLKLYCNRVRVAFSLCFFALLSVYVYNWLCDFLHSSSFAVS